MLHTRQKWAIICFPYTWFLEYSKGNLLTSMTINNEHILNECIKWNNNFFWILKEGRWKTAYSWRRSIWESWDAGFHVTESIQQLDGLMLLPGHNTASSDSFLKYLGCCNLEYPHVFLTLCVLVSLLLLSFLVLRVLDLLLLFSFHQKMEVLPLFSSGLVAYTWENYWFDTASNDRAAKFMFLDWNKLVANSTPSTLQSCDTGIIRELIEIAVGLKLLCIFYWFHPWQFRCIELSKIVLGFCAFWLGLLCSIVTRMEQFKEMWPVFLDGCRLHNCTNL